MTEQTYNQNVVFIIDFEEVWHDSGIFDPRYKVIADEFTRYYTRVDQIFPHAKELILIQREADLCDTLEHSDEVETTDDLVRQAIEVLFEERSRHSNNRERIIYITSTQMLELNTLVDQFAGQLHKDVTREVYLTIVNVLEPHWTINNYESPQVKGITVDLHQVSSNALREKFTELFLSHFNVASTTIADLSIAPEILYDNKLNALICDANYRKDDTFVSKAGYQTRILTALNSNKNTEMLLHQATSTCLVNQEYPNDMRFINYMKARGQLFLWTQAVYDIPVMTHCLTMTHGKLRIHSLDLHVQVDWILRDLAKTLIEDINQSVENYVRMSQQMLQLVLGVIEQREISDQNAHWCVEEMRKFKTIRTDMEMAVRENVRDQQSRDLWDQIETAIDNRGDNRLRLIKRYKHFFTDSI